jgi:hypothetical protein
VVVPKKNGKLWVCIDYRKLNATTITDAFSLPFTDGVLNRVAGHEMYSFLDGFSGYNQIRMAEEDQEKTAFVTEWGVFVAVVMMFGLKMAPATFQRIIMEIFEEYIPGFMRVFLDDFAVFGSRKMHLQHVEMCLQKCRVAITSGMLLGHIVSKAGIAMDPDMVKAIVEALAPHNAKALNRFLRQIRWHSRMICHLADFATEALAYTSSGGTTPRLELEAPAGVADDFPDAGVMAVTPEAGPKDDPDKWLIDMVYFLSHGVPTQGVVEGRTKASRSTQPSLQSNERQPVPQIRGRSMEMCGTEGRARGGAAGMPQ